MDRRKDGRTESISKDPFGHGRGSKKVKKKKTVEKQSKNRIPT